MPYRQTFLRGAFSDALPDVMRHRAKSVVVSLSHWEFTGILLGQLNLTLRATTTRMRRAWHRARVSTIASAPRLHFVWLTLLLLVGAPGVSTAQDVTMLSQTEVAAGASPGSAELRFRSETATTLVTSDDTWITIGCGTSSSGRNDEVLPNGCRLLNGRGTYGRFFNWAPNLTRARRVGRITIGDTTVLVNQEGAQSDWGIVDAGGYEIYHDAGKRSDAEKVRVWVDGARSLLLAKYGLSTLGRRLSIFLHPEPTQIAVGQRIDENIALAVSDSGSTNIHLLTPSSPRYVNSESSLGIAKTTDDYQAKVVVHEYVHAIQSTVTTNSGNTASFLRNLKEQLAEYDGLYHSTSGNLSSAPSLLARWGNRNRGSFVCCDTLADSQSLVIDSDYNGGALFMRFIAERFGESAHLRLLSTQEQTFVGALLKETAAPTVAALFDEFRRWSAGWSPTAQVLGEQMDSATVHPAEAGMWLEARSTNYTIFYQSGFERDVEFARVWMDRAEQLMRSKYGVSAGRYALALYLHPAPATGAGVGTATLNCCTQQSDGRLAGSIQYLTPSAPAWQTTQATTSLGLPFDENYHAKVLLHEYITLGHLAVQATRQGSGGWVYYNSSTPSWFTQGLQEFDGIFNTTESNRTTTYARLVEWGQGNRAKFVCCSTLSSELSIRITDEYNGGALLVAFLAAQFGEDVHARLLRNPAATFNEALLAETKPYDLGQLFARFRDWFNGGGK